MKITAIEPQQKNPQRVNIYLDGAFAFGLARIVSTWLRIGQELTEEKIASLKGEDEREVVYQKALHFLGYRPRSSMEVHRSLVKRGISETLVAETIERLQQNGLLSDEAFARTWAENRNEFRPRSKSALRMELRQKGVGEEIIQAVLEEQAGEETLALVAGRKYARRLQGLEWIDFRKKLGGFLARRGFSYATLAPVVSKIWEESQMADNGSTFENEE